MYRILEKWRFSWCNSFFFCARIPFFRYEHLAIVDNVKRKYKHLINSRIRNEKKNEDKVKSIGFWSMNKRSNVRYLWTSLSSIWEWLLH